MTTKASSKFSAVANFFKRLSSSILVIVGGGLLGCWIAEIGFLWLSGFSAGVRGAVWGSAAAAIIALWKSAINVIESLISAWGYIKQLNAHFDHTKALFGVATAVFGIVLGYRTFYPGFDPSPLASPEFVYIVSHQGRVAPSFIFAPSLLFRSAGLRDPNIKNFNDAIKISPDLFVDGSVSLTKYQFNSISNLASKLASECGGTDEPFAIKVYGFANNHHILNGKKERHPDSNILNLAIANLRGESLYKAFSESFANSCEEVSIDLKQWKSLEEMKLFRDNKVFRNMQIAPSSSIDYRSAVLVVSNPERILPKVGDE